jgi:hypothetical protein
MSWDSCSRQPELHCAGEGFEGLKQKDPGAPVRFGDRICKAALAVAEIFFDVETCG